MAKIKKKVKRKGRGPGLSKRPDRIETEKKLLEAGIEVFSKYGYEGASIQKISERSGVNVSLVNRYYGSKEGLLYAIGKEYASQASLTHFEYPPQDAVFDELFEYAKAELATFTKQKDIIRILVGRAATDEKFRKEMVSVVPLDQPEPFLEARLQSLKEKGLLRDDVSFLEVQFTLGFQFFATNFLAHMILELDEARTTELLRCFIETYARGLQVRINESN